MGVDEIRSFLAHLALAEHVGASTQSQALCALLFLYRRALGKDLGLVENIERARADPRQLLLPGRDNYSCRSRSS